MILLYAKNEDFAEFVRNNSDKFPRPVADVVEDNNEYASTDISDDSSIDSSNESASTPEIYDSSGHHIIDIDDDWDTDGLSDEYNKTEEINYDENEFPKGSDEFINDKNDTEELKPRTITLDDDDEAKKIIDETQTGNTGDDLDFDETFYPYYNMLNERGKKLYKQIYANANDLNKEFSPIIESTTHSELYNAMYSVIFDHPEIFWLDTSMYTEYDYKGDIIKVNMNFYDALGDINSAKNKFNDSTKELLKDAMELDSDIEKEKYIHDLLIEKITYKEGPLDQSAYSAIAEDETVCAGYAKAMQYLMQQLKIPTYCCVGWGGGFFNGGLHAWDIIKLESDYYNVDCTWDDQDPEVYDYFNVTDKKNYWHARLWNSRYLPACNGTLYAYEEESITNDKNGSNTNDNPGSSNSSTKIIGGELDEYGHHIIQN
jgi:hypothetical protein